MYFTTIASKVIAIKHDFYVGVKLSLDLHCAITTSSDTFERYFSGAQVIMYH